MSTTVGLHIKAISGILYVENDPVQEGKWTRGPQNLR